MSTAGKRADPNSERQVNEAKESERFRALPGVRRRRLVWTVCGEGRALYEVVGRSKRERGAGYLRMGLDDLAGLWRLTARR